MSCLHCGRGLRPKRKTAAEVPGTLVVAARGLCGNCYLHHKDRYAPRPTLRRFDEPPRPGVFYPPCVVCGRAIRPAGSLAADHPGTVQAVGVRCATCARRVREGRLKAVQERVRWVADASGPPSLGLSDVVSFPAVTVPGRFPAECVWGDCRWKDYGHSVVAIRAKAYTHAATHLEDQEEGEV